MRVIILVSFCFLVIVVSCSNVSDKEELEAIKSDFTTETIDSSTLKEEKPITGKNEGLMTKIYSVGMRITGSE